MARPGATGPPRGRRDHCRAQPARCPCRFRRLSARPCCRQAHNAAHCRAGWTAPVPTGQGGRAGARPRPRPSASRRSRRRAVHRTRPDFGPVPPGPPARIPRAPVPPRRARFRSVARRPATGDPPRPKRGRRRRRARQGRGRGRSASRPAGAAATVASAGHGRSNSKWCAGGPPAPRSGPAFRSGLPPCGRTRPRCRAAGCGGPDRPRRSLRRCARCP